MKKSRYMDVINAIEGEMTNIEIAIKINISPSGVNFYLKNMADVGFLYRRPKNTLKVISTTNPWVYSVVDKNLTEEKVKSKINFKLPVKEVITGGRIISFDDVKLQEKLTETSALARRERKSRTLKVWAGAGSLGDAVFTASH